VQENLQAELFTLFDKLDTRRDGTLTRSEFISFMNALDVNLSRKYSIKVRAIRLSN
jgi:Ca2+-binding EF-hand superfamily protein